MFDLSKQKVEVKCNCGRKHFATLQDIINRKVVHCSCGTNIQLTDAGGSVRKSVSNANSAFKRLENSFKKLGR